MAKQLPAREQQIKGLLAQAHKQIKSILQDEKKANRFTALSLQIAKSPKLAKCNPLSIVESLIGVASLDLDPDPNLGQVYIVPYGDEAQLQLGYRGLITLLDRAGFSVKAYPVYDVDKFDVEVDDDGWNEKIKFKPNYDEREEGDSEWEREHLKYIVALAKDRTSGEMYKVIMSKKQIEKIRKMSASQKVYNQASKRYEISDKWINIWGDFPIEMALKTAIKKLGKKLPLNSQASRAIAVDELIDIGKKIDLKKTFEEEVIIEKNNEPEVIEVDVNQILLKGSGNGKGES